MGFQPAEKRRFEWGWIVIALCVGLTVYLALDAERDDNPAPLEAALFGGLEAHQGRSFM